jgi:predicted transposase YbfD/YdcC
MELRPDHIVIVFSRLEDPRLETDNRRHIFHEVVVVAFCAILCGFKTWEDIAAYAEDREEWLKKFLQLPNGVCSASTFQRVFSAIDPKDFNRCFQEWMRVAGMSLSGDQICIDGKCVRGSGKGKGATAAIHMVSAWSTERGIVLGQEVVSEKSNEITAIPEILESLNVQGALVSSDAMGCQKAIAEKIIHKGGDYLFSLKGNQSTLQGSVEEIFRRTETPARERYQIDDFSEEKIKKHGRQEQRICRVVYRKKQKEGWSFVDSKDEWKSLETLIRVSSYRKDLKSGKEEQEERFYISSSKKGAKDILLATRNHWHIENKLHWVLDVQWGDDQAQKRERNAAANVSILRRAALNLMKQDKTYKNTRRARVHAILNTEFMEKLIWGNAL